MVEVAAERRDEAPHVALVDLVVDGEQSLAQQIPVDDLAFFTLVLAIQHGRTFTTA